MSDSCVQRGGVFGSRHPCVRRRDCGGNRAQAATPDSASSICSSRSSRVNGRTSRWFDALGRPGIAEVHRRQGRAVPPELLDEHRPRHVRAAQLGDDHVELLGSAEQQGVSRVRNGVDVGIPRARARGSRPRAGRHRRSRTAPAAAVRMTSTDVWFITEIISTRLKRETVAGLYRMVGVPAGYRQGECRGISGGNRRDHAESP